VYELSSQYKDLRQKAEDDPDDDRPKKKAKGPAAGAEGGRAWQVYFATSFNAC
jgi:hypothetical protein